MKSFISILIRMFGGQTKGDHNASKSIADYNREALVKQGRDQFKKLLDKGLSVPVALS